MEEYLQVLSPNRKVSSSSHRLKDTISVWSFSGFLPYLLGGRSTVLVGFCICLPPPIKRLQNCNKICLTTNLSYNSCHVCSVRLSACAQCFMREYRDRDGATGVTPTTKTLFQCPVVSLSPTWCL